MSLWGTKDYARENRKLHGTTRDRQGRPKVKLPTQYKTDDSKFLIHCPTGCQQARTKQIVALEWKKLQPQYGETVFLKAGKKTFDIRIQTCRKDLGGCGFKKLPKDAKMHGVNWQKASQLLPRKV